MEFDTAATLFAYRDLDTEIRSKWHSGFAPAGAQAPAVWTKLAAAGLSPAALGGISELWTALGRIDFDKMYANYLCHPLRVAAALAEHPEFLNADTVALALCHNFREVMEDSTLAGPLEDIERAFLAAPAREALDILYTDRRRERDPAYLRTYYDGIAGAGSTLLVLKGLDKLDNHLTYAFEELEPYHHAVVTDQLVPRLIAVMPRLGEYLTALVRYVSDPAVIDRFRAEAASGCQTPQISA